MSTNRGRITADLSAELVERIRGTDSHDRDQVAALRAWITSRRLTEQRALGARVVLWAVDGGACDVDDFAALANAARIIDSTTI